MKWTIALLLLFLLTVLFVIIHWWNEMPPEVSTENPPKDLIWMTYLITRVFVWTLFLGFAAWVSYLLQQQWLLETKHRQAIAFEDKTRERQGGTGNQSTNDLQQSTPISEIKRQTDALSKVLNTFHAMKKEGAIEDKDYKSLKTHVKNRLEEELKKLNP